MADSKSVSGSGNATSDAFTFSSDTVEAMIELKADHSGTPGADDYVDFSLLLTLGDPDGAVADEYASTAHAIPLGRCDCNEEDPAIRVVNCPIGKGGKIYAENNAGESVTVSACIHEVGADGAKTEIQVEWT